MKRSDDRNTITKMVEARLACDRKISLQKEKIDSFHAAYGNRFESVKFTAQRTIELQEKLRKLKTELRKEEDDTAEASTVKARNEAKRVAIAESIAMLKVKLTELKRSVEVQRARKNKYSALISQHSEALAASQEKFNQSIQDREHMEEAILWYNRALSFRIETGHGVKFIFTNINRQSPNKEYSFAILLKGNTYTVLECNPSLDTEELVKELNKSNELFKFVRIMRQKFQEAASGVHFDGSPNSRQSRDVSPAAPIAQVSSDNRRKSPYKKKGVVQSNECNSSTIKAYESHERRSMGSRRSPRLAAAYDNAYRS